MKPMKVTKEKFEELLQGGKPILLDFYATWCGPCRMIAPILEDLAEEREDILVLKADVGEERELAAEFGVMSIPTLVAFKGGQEYRRVTGARPKAALIALFD